MRADEIIKRLAAMPPRAPGVATVPSLELVAMMIRVCRGLRQWKKETLADFAQVSLSTVERAERAEQVGVESLDRIARALGYEPGAFTKSRVPISREQATKELVEEWGHLEPVAMREFQTHRQIRMIAAMPAYLIHRPELGSDYDGQVESLIEWLDLVSMVMGSDIIVGGERVRRREFYGQVLAAVDEFRCRGVTVLVGFMDAPLPGIRDWKVAVISVTPKLSDPGASKRRTLFVDRRSVQSRTTLQTVFAGPVRANIDWVDIEALFVACGGEVQEGRGSQVRVVPLGIRAVFHRPHPQKETDRGAVRSVRRFLLEAGIEP